MATGDIVWSDSTALTVTALQSLATSSSHTTGWTSAALDNTGLQDRKINANIKVGASPTAGEIRMYLVEQHHNVGGTVVWPDVFDGTQGTKTVTSADIRNKICRHVDTVATDATAGRVYPLQCPSVAAIFEGGLPQRFLVFITHSTVAALAASLNAVWEQSIDVEA